MSVGYYSFFLLPPICIVKSLILAISSNIFIFQSSRVPSRIFFRVYLMALRCVCWGNDDAPPHTSSALIWSYSSYRDSSYFHDIDLVNVQFIRTPQLGDHQDIGSHICFVGLCLVPQRSPFLGVLARRQNWTGTFHYLYASLLLCLARINFCG